jgi:hypothetical protein
MSKFQVKKKLELNFLGEGWEEAYISFNAPSYGEIKEFSKKTKVDEGENKEEKTVDNEKAVDEGMKLLELLFIEGKAFDGKALVDITKEDIKDLPIGVINKTFNMLTESTLTPNL